MPSERLVKDLIRPLDQYFHVKEDDTIEDALRLLKKARQEKRPPCLLVVARQDPDKEIIKGFVTPREVVFGLTTRFLRGAAKSGPIFWEGQLEAECLGGSGKKIAQIMAPVKAYARESEMLMEAVFLLHRYNEEFLPVASEEEVVGTIHIYDIFNEILQLASAEQKAPARAAVPEDKK
jgi:CBS domain-containing protein